VKTLAECVEIALQHHPRLGAARATVDGADAREWQATSDYLPHVDASYSATRSKSSSAARTQGPFGENVVSRFSFYDSGVRLSQVLFDFGQNLNEIRAARARTRSLEADAVATRDDVVLNVKQSYFDLLAARRLEVVAADTVRSDRLQLELAQGRNEVGFAPKLDVTRSQVQLASAELDLLTARNAVSVAEETLRNALGLEGPLDFELEDALERRVVALSEDEALSRAYATRPELRSLVEQESAAEQDIKALQKDYLPNVTGDAVWGYSGSDYPLANNWNVGANVNLSLTNGGLTTARIAESKADLRRLKHEQDRVRQDVALEVRRAVLDLRRAAESIEVATRAAEQSRENLALAEGRYRTGVGSVIELSDAQTARASAEAESVRALYTYQSSLAALERAIGGPVEPKP
jgi:outer membrane protein